jgi:hypothetical protein
LPAAVPGQRFREGDIKDWELMNDIHIQTAYPVVG